MKVLVLFAGTRSIEKAFEAKGHEVFSVEWNKNFENIDLYDDVNNITAKDILEKFGHPDVVWASPDCTTFSIAAISHHRRKNPETGNLDPVSDYAKFCDKTDQHVLSLIKELNPTFYFIENPRGGMRKMTWMQDLPRYTVTYCFSGDTKIITRNGHKTFKELEGQEVSILNRLGNWETAKVRNYGRDELFKLTLSRAKKIKTIYTTKNHIWFAARPTGTKKNYSKVTTENLKQGMLLPYSIPHKQNVEIIPEYVCRGFIFGDGWNVKSNHKAGSFVQFVNEKIEMLPYFDGYGGKRWRDDKDNCTITKACSFPYEWKTDIPKCTDDYSKVFSWIAGYIAADGSCSSTNGQLTLFSSKKENLEAVRELAESIGIGTYSINEAFRKGYGKEKTPLYQMTFMRDDVDEKMILRSKHKKAFIEHKNTKFQPRRWSIVNVENTGIIEDVFCCETDSSHTFTLEDNIVTHNCKYGDDRMKPTDIWTNHPDPKFLPMCKNGDPCHVSAPRGSRTGTQGLKGSVERSKIPQKLCEHIVDICEEYIK